MRPASRVTAMSSRLRSLVHPLRAWCAFAAALAERADAEAVAAGLTVEVVSNGVHRYRDPRLDQLAAHRNAATAAKPHTGPPHRTRRTQPAGWGRGGTGADCPRSRALRLRLRVARDRLRRPWSWDTQRRR
jgi:hypothetical protein